MPQDAQASGDEFFIGGLQVDHEVAIGLAEAHHASRRQHVEHHLGRRAGFHARRTCQYFGADDDRDRKIGMPADRRVAIAGQCDCRRPLRARMIERTDDVWRTAAGGNTNDDVARREFDRVEVVGTLPGRVFGAFDGRRQRRFATRDEPDHQARIGIERRRALGRIQNPEPTRSACTHVDQAAARAEFRRDQVDRRGDGIRLQRDRRRYFFILAIDQPDEVDRSQAVQVFRRRIPGLGCRYLTHDFLEITFFR